MSTKAATRNRSGKIGAGTAPRRSRAGSSSRRSPPCVSPCKACRHSGR
jgi:hypothetical protein